MFPSMYLSWGVVAMSGLADLVVWLKPWRIVPATVGLGFHVFIHVNRLGRPMSARLMALIHPLLREPYCTVRSKIGRVNTFVPKYASACMPALIEEGDVVPAQ